MTVQPRELRRQLRRAVRPRKWSWRTKVAVGAWIPAAIVAAALFTGPNRTVSESSPGSTEVVTTLPPARSLVLPIKPPPTIPIDAAIGSWLLGRHAQRAPYYIKVARNAAKPPRLLTRHPGRAGVAGIARGK